MATNKEDTKKAPAKETPIVAVDINNPKHGNLTYEEIQELGDKDAK